MRMSSKRSNRPRLEMCSIRRTTNDRPGGAQEGGTCAGWSAPVQVLGRGRQLQASGKPKPEDQITQSGGARSEPKTATGSCKAHLLSHVDLWDRRAWVQIVVLLLTIWRVSGNELDLSAPRFNW